MKRSRILIILLFVFAIVLICNFAYTAPPKKMSMGLFSPANHCITTEASVVISGTVKGVLSVKINGVDAYVDDTGLFQVEMPLSMGKNLILIQGVSGKKKLFIKRKVLRRQRIFIAQEPVLLSEKKTLYDMEKNLYDKAIQIQSQETIEGLSGDQKDQLEEQKQQLVEESAKIDQMKQDIAKKLAELDKDKKNVTALASLGILKPSDKVNLDDKIVRAELAIIAVKAKGLPIEDVADDVYKDVPRDFWAAAYIKAAVDNGIMKPYPDGSFKPLAWVTQAEGKAFFDKLKSIKL